VKGGGERKCVCGEKYILNNVLLKYRSSLIRFCRMDANYAACWTLEELIFRPKENDGSSSQTERSLESSLSPEETLLANHSEN
jgi:hypothetical protein